MSLVASNFRWLATGEAALNAMLDAIRAARRSVRLETYIFTASPIGIEFLAALVQAGARGARVQVLVDAFGSMKLPESFWEPLKKAGGEFRWFNPLTLKRWSYRDHRKLLVCDDAVAFVGGFNIAQEYAGDGVTSGWRDLGLRITGSLVTELAGTFDTFFSRADARHKLLQRLRQAPNTITAGHGWKFLLSGPGRLHGALRRTLADDVAGARDVKIISAYFLPTWRLHKELLRVVKRGGRVQLILAGQSDVKLAQLATRRLYTKFLRAGVEIYEYQPQILHAKLFIVDDVVYAGSANLDTRSLRINYELLVRLADPPLAAEAREIFGGDLAHCRRVDAATWRRSRTFWSRLREDWAYFVLARVDPYLARRQLRTLR